MQAARACFLIGVVLALGSFRCARLIGGSRSVDAAVDDRSSLTGEGRPLDAGGVSSDRDGIGADGSVKPEWRTSKSDSKTAVDGAYGACSSWSAWVCTESGKAVATCGSWVIQCGGQTCHCSNGTVGPVQCSNGSGWSFPGSCSMGCHTAFNNGCCPP